MFIQVVRLVAFVFGAVLGAMVAQLVQAGRVLGATESYGIILFIILGAALGYLLGGAIGRQLQKALAWAENSITRMAWWEIVLAVSGLIVGLVLATLVSQPMRVLGSSQTRAVATVVAFIVLGALGLQLALAKKDDFGRFFGRVSRQGGETLFERDATPKILDTSVIIDGRIADIVRTRFLEGRLLVPRFVLSELQTVADSEDVLRRNRGRRGLDVLNALQREAANPIEIYDADFPELTDVDAKLVRLATEISGAIVTNDYNLNKVAGIQGVSVLNINELSNALKPAVLPGEEMSVHVLREGKEAGQGVAYLDDGTMVVVDGGKQHIGHDIGVAVTSVLQTPAGRMIFTKVREERPER